MKGTKFQKTTIIKIIYGIFIGSFIILSLFPYFSVTYTYEPHSYTKYFPGWFELVFGGWVGIGLIVLSVILLNSQKGSIFIVFGFSGCILILINLIIRLFMLGITIEISFFLSFALLIALFFMNVVSILNRKKEVKKSLIPKLERVKIKKPEEPEIPLGEREIAKEKAVKYIKRMQLKLTELPYYKIISKTGVLKKDLNPLVKELISNNEIDAEVRDFVIIFHKIPKETEEELQKIKKELILDLSKVEELIDSNEFSLSLEKLNHIKELASTYELKGLIAKAKQKIATCKKLEIKRRKEEEQKIQVENDLQQKMNEINNLIQEKKINVALANLDKIKIKAKKYNLFEFLDEVKAKIIQCKELELEIKRRKEKFNLKTKLEKRLLYVEILIKEHKLVKAIENLIEIEKIAKTNEFTDLLGIIADKIKYCKSLETDTVNRIKSTILNYAKKTTRLELIDISEKSGIKDENIIEEIVKKMIRNKEVNAEYFSSSKSILFFKQEKETVSKLKPIEKRLLKVFLSYSTLDAKHFKIDEIVERLQSYPEIDKVFFWEADSGENIVTFMERTLKMINVFVLFCSENALKSKAVEDEWQAAFQLRKKGLMKIVPIYEKEEYIPYLLMPLLNVKFSKEDFDGFIQKLYEEILR